MSFSILRHLRLAALVACSTLAFAQNASDTPNLVGTVIISSGPCGAHLAGGRPCQSDEAPAANIGLIFRNTKSNHSVPVRTDEYGFLKAHLEAGHYVLSIAESPLVFSMIDQELDIQDGKIVQLMLQIDLKRP